MENSSVVDKIKLFTFFLFFLITYDQFDNFFEIYFLFFDFPKIKLNNLFVKNSVFFFEFPLSKSIPFLYNKLNSLIEFSFKFVVFKINFQHLNIIKDKKYYYYINEKEYLEKMSQCISNRN